MKNTIFWDKLRILVTNGCNYRCPFCHNEGQTSKDRFNVMNLDNFKLLIDYLKDEEISEITFSGGEPFLNPNLIEMIKYVSERTNWEVSCASNLSLVTKERIQQLANIPLKFNIQFPFIDASKFQKSTGSGNLSRVMENIRLVRESGLGVGLNSVIQSNSKEDVKEMVEFALKEELPLKLLKMSLHLSSSSCVYTLQHRTLVIFRRNQYVLQYPGTLRFLFLPWLQFS